MKPIDAPRPSDGLVHAHESATASTPVATGVPSTTNERCRSSIFAMIATSSSIGSPSAQCATSGIDFHVRIQVSMSFSPRSAASFALDDDAEPQVPLSAGSVSVEIVPHGMRIPHSIGGISPSAERKCRPKYMKPESSSSSSGARAPIAVNIAGSDERRPAASTTRSACSSSPPSVRTPTTCGIPLRHLAVGQQRGDSDSPAALRGPACAPQPGPTPFPSPGRRAEYERELVVGVAVAADHLLGNEAHRVVTDRAAAPRASSTTSGSSASSSARKRGANRWIMRNWLTPRRSQLRHAASASSAAARCAARRRAPAPSRRGRHERATSRSSARRPRRRLRRCVPSRTPSADRDPSPANAADPRLEQPPGSHESGPRHDRILRGPRLGSFVHARAARRTRAAARPDRGRRRRGRIVGAQRTPRSPKGQTQRRLFVVDAGGSARSPIPAAGSRRRPAAPDPRSDPHARQRRRRARSRSWHESAAARRRRRAGAGRRTTSRRSRAELVATAAASPRVQGNAAVLQRARASSSPTHRARLRPTSTTTSPATSTNAADPCATVVASVLGDGADPGARHHADRAASPTRPDGRRARVLVAVTPSR